MSISIFSALNQSVWHDVVLKYDLLAKAKAALADGRIRHLGFSFHGDYAAFYEIVNGRRSVVDVPDPVQLHGHGQPGRHTGTASGNA